MCQVTLTEAGAMLPELLRRAEAGEEALLGCEGMAVARLVPVAAPNALPAPRVPGDMKGRINILPECWSLDEEIARDFEDSRLHT